MNALIHVAVALAAILFNSLWQDVIIVALVAGLLRLMPRANASTRYAVWWLALVACIAVPTATTLPFVVPHETSTRATSKASVLPATLQQHTQRNASTAKPSTNTGSMSSAAQPTGFGLSHIAVGRAQLSVPWFVGAGIAALWLLAALAIVVRLTIALLQLERLKRDALPLPIEFRDEMASWLGAVKGGRDVRLCVSDETEVPVAVGLFDAMILIPRHLLETLAHTELDQISLHELGHLRRADDWTNAIQRIIAAILFFNPAVRYIGTQLDIEREVACDDWVLNYTKAVRPYAMCLTKMAETTAWPHRPVPAPGVFVTRKNISIRIERLLRAGRDIGTGISPAPATLAAACFLAVAFVAWSVAPSFAFDSTTRSDETTSLTSTAQRTTTPAASVKPGVTASPATVATAHALEKPEIVKIVTTSNDAKALALKQALQHAALPIAPALIPASSKPVAPLTPPTQKLVLVQLDGKALAAQIKNDLAKAGLGDDEHSGPGCTGCNFARANYSGKDLHGGQFIGSNFESADFSSANLSGANLSGSNFAHANLRNANLRNANLTGTNLETADLTGADLTGANLNGIHMENATFGAAQARQIIAGCHGCSFNHLDLHGVDLSGLTITGDSFRNVDLSNVNFSNSQLMGVEFMASNLTGINVKGAHLTGVEFSHGTNIDGVDWTGASLTGVDLSKH